MFVCDVSFMFFSCFVLLVSFIEGRLVEWRFELKVLPFQNIVWLKTKTKISIPLEPTQLFYTEFQKNPFFQNILFSSVLLEW